jgi:hypothetical protein
MLTYVPQPDVYGVQMADKEGNTPLRYLLFIFLALVYLELSPIRCMESCKNPSYTTIHFFAFPAFSRIFSLSSAFSRIFPLLQHGTPRAAEGDESGSRRRKLRRRRNGDLKFQSWQQLLLLLYSSKAASLRESNIAPTDNNPQEC